MGKMRCRLLVLLLLPSLGFAQQVWQLQNSNFPSDAIAASLSAVNDHVCWAAGLKVLGNSPYPGYIRTTDGGNTWVCDSIPGAENGYVSQIAALSADTAYAAVFVSTVSNSKGVYKTTDGGVTWTKQNAYASSLVGPSFFHFFDANNGVVIGDQETYTTANGGSSWNPVSMPARLTNEYTWNGGNTIAGAGNRVWFGTTRRLFSSTDKGYTWSASTPLSIDTMWYYAIAFQDSNTGMYAVTGAAHVSAYRKTTDGGTTWNDITDSVISGIATSCIRHVPGTTRTYLITGSNPPERRGFACTFDAGGNWRLIDTSRMYTIAFLSPSVGWGSQVTTNAVYKYVGRPLSVEDGIAVPASYLLGQNYPNPFNPSTTIRYALPHSSFVTLAVYNTLGQQVAQLVNEQQQVGYHDVVFRGDGLASGVYFYRIQAGDFVASKKLLLLK